MSSISVWYGVVLHPKNKHAHIVGHHVPEHTSAPFKVYRNDDRWQAWARLPYLLTCAACGERYRTSAGLAVHRAADHAEGE